MTTTNNTPIIILCEDDLLHTNEHPYCDDPTCPCHDDADELAERRYTQEGMAESREGLPCYGFPVLDTAHPPYCNCPSCEPDGYDENPFL